MVHVSLMSIPGARNPFARRGGGATTSKWRVFSDQTRFEEKRERGFLRGLRGVALKGGLLLLFGRYYLLAAVVRGKALGEVLDRLLAEFGGRLLVQFYHHRP